MTFSALWSDQHQTESFLCFLAHIFDVFQYYIEAKRKCLPFDSYVLCTKHFLSWCFLSHAVRHSGFVASNHFWQLRFQWACYNHKVAHTSSTSVFSSWWTQTPRSCRASYLSLDFTQSSQMKRVRLTSAALNPVWHAGRAINTCPWMFNPAS